jgi:beta-fructofuranosidase
MFVSLTALALLSTFAQSLHHFSPEFVKRADSNTTACNIDQTQPPPDLTLCGNSTLFSIWRPKARFIAPEGWQNDPQGQWAVLLIY